MTKVNQEAKKERHQKLYEGQYHSFIGRIWFHTKRFLKAAYRFIMPSRKRLSHFMHPLDHMPAPRRLYTQISIFSIGLLILTSVNTSSAYNVGQGVGAEYDYLALDIIDNYVTDDEGYLIKNMPLEGEAVYDQNRFEMVEHEVQPGETLSVIAYRYGINISSIRYANPDLGSADRLSIGQTIQIPPEDGLYVIVESGDSLVSIVDDYDGDIDDTKLFNNFDDSTSLTAGEEIFIVGGEPQITYVATAPAATSSSSYSSSGYSPQTIYTSVTPNGSGWIRPTSGIITQGYHAGHYALDIADSSRPLVLAAASGTVIKADASGWGGGYGYHIIIDHGNGVQTLYAHNEVLYVNVGDRFEQGQAIAKMGNTGRVYGRTGIHLHFELTVNGIKQNPLNMGVW